MLSEHLYSVLSDTDTLGYVQRVDHVFVALSGGDLNQAVEVGQSLSLKRAVELIVAA